MSSIEITLPENPLLKATSSSESTLRNTVTRQTQRQYAERIATALQEVYLEKGDLDRWRQMQLFPKGYNLAQLFFILRKVSYKLYDAVVISERCYEASNVDQYLSARIEIRKIFSNFKNLWGNVCAIDTQNEIQQYLPKEFPLWIQNFLSV